MFATIQQNKVKPECESEFKKLWLAISHYLKKECGALGSALHKGSDGSWITYRRWPDKQTHDAAMQAVNEKNPNLSSEIKKILLSIAGTLQQTHVIAELEMMVMEDLLDD